MLEFSFWHYIRIIFFRTVTGGLIKNGQGDVALVLIGTRRVLF